MYLKKNKITLLLFAIGLFSCNNEPLEKIQFNGLAQGTYYSITYFDTESRNFQYDIDSILAAFDQSVSVYQKNSIVSRINRNEKNIVLDDWFIKNFNLSQRISSETEGSFDITIAPLANIWGFGTFEKPDSINPQLVDSLRQYVDFRKVKIEDGKVIKENSNIQLNFNAIAQGYAVDVVGEFIQSQGIDNFLVDIGGEIFAKGSKPSGEAWKIGIEVPDENAEKRIYSSIISINNEAVATSGNYRKFYEINGVKYAHSLDPITGFPVKHSLLSTTVIAPTSAEADAYATAFMVLGVEKTLEYAKTNNSIKVYLMYDVDGEVHTAMSDNFKAYLESDSN